MTPFFRSVFIFCLLALLAACAGLPSQLQPLAPVVTLADFKVHKVGLLEQTYKFQLRLQNPNPFPIPVTSLEYALFLNEKEFIRRIANQAITVPAQGQEVVEVEVVSNLLQILQEWKDWQSILNRSLNYHLSGGVRLANWAPLMPFDQRGEVILSWGEN